MPDNTRHDGPALATFHKSGLCTPSPCAWRRCEATNYKRCAMRPQDAEGKSPVDTSSLQKGQLARPHESQLSWLSFRLSVFQSGILPCALGERITPQGEGAKFRRFARLLPRVASVLRPAGRPINCISGRPSKEAPHHRATLGSGFLPLGSTHFDTVFLTGALLVQVVAYFLEHGRGTAKAWPSI